MEDLEDDSLKPGMRILRHIYNSEDDDVVIYANSTHLQEEAIAIRNLLNFYENISAGVAADIEMIKKS
ncbi:hypothetical protein HUE58_01190 [Candidatus Ruthia endofausta]|uniref:Uncharacterized protein n=1 Tax=Candidatus Ruthia endofausta TaxID=2738852 RepID=A0A6N0HNC4_9GAMM|nr:hypothetical protein [Candidatus Ruthia endofausta]QKQ23826.1 hypothetical protein HUE58_01190 [Candidatus Ruthia endofausta]